MSVTTTKKTTLRDSLNGSNPNDISDSHLELKIGDALAVLFQPLLNAPAVIATPNATDLTTAQNLANALKVAVNLLLTSLGLARPDLALTVTSSVATLSAQASQVFQVNATTGTTTGIKKLVPRNRVPVTGEVSWDGNKTLTFATVDAVTACDVIYSKTDGSQKLSLLMADYPAQIG